jgi:hypothetical protein
MGKKITHYLFYYLFYLLLSSTKYAINATATTAATRIAMKLSIVLNPPLFGPGVGVGVGVGVIVVVAVGVTVALVVGVTVTLLDGVALGVTVAGFHEPPVPLVPVLPPVFAVQEIARFTTESIPSLLVVSDCDAVWPLPSLAVIVTVVPPGTPCMVYWPPLLVVTLPVTPVHVTVTPLVAVPCTVTVPVMLTAGKLHAMLRLTTQPLLPSVYPVAV